MILGVVSTFPPREDGIATFTRDLLDAVCRAHSGITARIAAITDPGSYYAYPRQVRWEIDQSDPERYAEAGRALSRSGAAVISLQHEFGLYGVWGDPLEDYTPALLGTLDKPIVTTLHTVLSQPRSDIREAVRRLCAQSVATVVMVRVGAKILAEDYGVDRTRLVTIPHGVPEVRPVDRHRLAVLVMVSRSSCAHALLGCTRCLTDSVFSLRVKDVHVSGQGRDPHLVAHARAHRRSRPRTQRNGLRGHGL
jgi:hypothetical protein